MICAVDPGKVSGWAVLKTDGTFSAGELDHMTLLGDVWDHLKADDILVCEAYLITEGTIRKSRGGNWSLEQIGALRWMAHERNAEFHLQTPAEAKRFATDSKLTAAGWLTRTSGGHANDAARHLLTFLAKRDTTRFAAVMGLHSGRHAVDSL